MPNISDQTIYHWLRELRVAHSQYHVSALCGRSPGWFSSTRCQGRNIPASTLLTLVAYMEHEATREKDPLARERLRIIIACIRQECMQRNLHKKKHNRCG